MPLRLQENKSDLLLSLKSGNVCPEHRQLIERAFNVDVSAAFQHMIKAMKRIPDDSTDDLPSASVKGEVDVAILTFKYEEANAALKGLTRRRRVEGVGTSYSLGRVWTLAEEELRVAVGMTSGQGQAPAQTLATSMLNDLNVCLFHHRDQLLLTPTNVQTIVQAFATLRVIKVIFPTCGR